jgi:hypothetical protein
MICVRIRDKIWFECGGDELDLYRRYDGYCRDSLLSLKEALLQGSESKSSKRRGENPTKRIRRLCLSLKAGISSLCSSDANKEERRVHEFDCIIIIRFAANQ